MKNVRIYIILLLWGGLLSISILYLWVFRDYVSQAYHGTAPQWFQQWVDFLYPRFLIEKQRFELSFFHYKTDQIIIRSAFAALIISILLVIQSPTKFIAQNIREHGKSHYLLLTKIFYLGLVYYTWTWIFDFERIVRMEAFYKGVLLYRIFHLPILPLPFYYFLYLIYILSIVFVLFRYREILFSILAVIILLLFQGYSFSFEKIDHGQVTLTYAAMLMPALLYEIKIQDQYKSSPDSHKISWTLFLIQLTIAGVYFLAGAEKLFTSGFDWATAETFRSYVRLHEQSLGIIVAENKLLAHLLPWGALLFQLGFILVLFQKRLTLLFLILGIFFHLGTKLLMDIGPYISSWIFVYIFFVDWDVVSLRWKELISNRHKKSQKGA